MQNRIGTKAFLSISTVVLRISYKFLPKFKKCTVFALPHPTNENVLSITLYPVITLAAHPIYCAFDFKSQDLIKARSVAVERKQTQTITKSGRPSKKPDSKTLHSDGVNDLCIITDDLVVLLIFIKACI